MASASGAAAERKPSSSTAPAKMTPEQAYDLEDDAVSRALKLPPDPQFEALLPD